MDKVQSFTVGKGVWRIKRIGEGKMVPLFDAAIFVALIVKYPSEGCGDVIERHGAGKNIGKNFKEMR